MSSLTPTPIQSVSSSSVDASSPHERPGLEQSSSSAATVSALPSGSTSAPPLPPDGGQLVKNELRAAVRSAFSSTYFSSLGVRSGVSKNMHALHGEHMRLGRAANQLVRRILNRLIERLVDTLPNDIKPSGWTPDLVQDAFESFIGEEIASTVVEVMRRTGKLDPERVTKSHYIPIPVGGDLLISSRIQVTAALQALAQDLLRSAGEYAMSILQMEDLSEPQCRSVPLEGDATFKETVGEIDSTCAFVDAEGATIGYGIIRVLHVQYAVWQDGAMSDLFSRLDLMDDFGIVLSMTDSEPESPVRRRWQSKLGPTWRLKVGIDSNGPKPEAAQLLLVVPQTMAQWIRRDPHLYLDDYPATQACLQNLCKQYAWFHQPVQIERELQKYLSRERSPTWWPERFHISPIAFYGRTMQPRWCPERAGSLARDSDTEDQGASEYGADSYQDYLWLAYSAHSFDLEDADGRVFPLLVEYSPESSHSDNTYNSHGGIFERYTGRQLATIDCKHECATLRPCDAEFARFFRRYRPHGLESLDLEELEAMQDLVDRIEFDLPASGERAPNACRAQWPSSTLEELVRLCIAGIWLRRDADAVWGLSAFRSLQPAEVRRRFGLARLRHGFQQDDASPQQQRTHSWIPDDLLSIIDEYAPTDLPFIALDQAASSESSSPVESGSSELTPSAATNPPGDFEQSTFLLRSELDGRRRPIELKLVIDDNDAHSRRQMRRNPCGKMVPPADRPPVCPCSIQRLESSFL